MRRVLIAIIALICVEAQAQNMQAVLRRAGASSGEVEYDYNLVRDITGNGYSLTNIGTELEYVGSEWIGHFNKTNYLTTASLAPVIAADTVGSVVGRIRCNKASSSVGVIWCFGDKGDSLYSFLSFYQNNTFMSLIIYDNNVATFNSGFSGYTVTTNWIDFALVQDGIGILLYVDSVKYLPITTVNDQYWNARITDADYISIGTAFDAGTPDILWEGDVDYITYYSTVINEADVTNLYNDVAITNIPVASWDMRPETK